MNIFILNIFRAKIQCSILDKGNKCIEQLFIKMYIHGKIILEHTAIK